MEYTYEKVGTVSPDLDAITTGVETSEMIDKSLEYCKWNETDGILRIYFTDELISGDKTILDGIVG